MFLLQSTTRKSLRIETMIKGTGTLVVYIGILENTIKARLISQRS